MSEAAAFSTLEPGAMNDPYPTYDRLRTTDPVHWSEGDGAWVLSRYADVSALMSDRSLKVIELAAIIAHLAELARLDLSELHSVMEAILFFRNPPEHGPERRFLVSTLAAVPITSMAVIIEDLAAGLLAPLRRDGRLNVATELADRLPPMVLGRILGLSDEIVLSLLETLSDVSMAFDRGRSLRFYSRANGHVAEAKKVVAAEIAKRRRSPSADGLSRMIALAAESEKPIDDSTMASRALFLLSVGVETTASLIGNSIKAVIEGPGVYPDLAADPSLAAAAIEETLRFDTPIQQVTRAATGDFEIDGRPVRSGDRLVLLVGAAGRDPDVYPDPHRFIIGRSGPPTLAFGAGVHFCIGASLARMEAGIVLRQFAELPLRPRVESDATRWPHRTIRRLLSYEISARSK